MRIVVYIVDGRRYLKGGLVVGGGAIFPSYSRCWCMWRERFQWRERSGRELSPSVEMLKEELILCGPLNQSRREIHLASSRRCSQKEVCRHGHPQLLIPDKTSRNVKRIFQSSHNSSTNCMKANSWMISAIAANFSIVSSSKSCNSYTPKLSAQASDTRC